MACINVSLCNIGPVKEAELSFSDFTVLVGPQASGKSLTIQLLKLLLDTGSIVRDMKDYGLIWENVEGFLFHYLGEGMQQIIKANSVIRFNGKEIELTKEINKAFEKKQKIKCCAIPAQRVLAYSHGWPRPFMSYDDGEPYILRKFSETLRLDLTESISRFKNNIIFPNRNKINNNIRKLISDSILEGGTVVLDKSHGKQRVMMKPKGIEIPVSLTTGSSGQREFIPLLLGLYHLLPAGKVAKKQNYETIIIEEIEMGLHPKAIIAVMYILMEFIKRGYRVILSTHSSTVLDIVWAIQEIKTSKRVKEKKYKLFSKLFGFANSNLAETCLKKKYSIYYYKPVMNEIGRFNTVDISSLDPSSDNDDINGWGGLTSFSGDIAKIVSELYE